MKPSLSDRIGRLERQCDTVRASRALLAPGSRRAHMQADALLRYLYRAIAKLRALERQIRPGLSAMAPRRTPPAAVTVVRATVRPRDVATAWPAPIGQRTIRDAGVELITSWTPHRESPTLIGAYPRKAAL